MVVLPATLAAEAAEGWKGARTPIALTVLATLLARKSVHWSKTMGCKRFQAGEEPARLATTPEGRQVISVCVGSEAGVCV